MVWLQLVHQQIDYFKWVILNIFAISNNKIKILNTKFDRYYWSQNFPKKESNLKEETNKKGEIKSKKNEGKEGNEGRKTNEMWIEQKNKR